MKTLVVSLGAIALSAAGIANAGEQPAKAGKYPSKEESIGLLGGGLIGAAAGGPVGAVIGFALGGLLGDRMDTQKQTVVALKGQLGEAHDTMNALNRKITESDRSIAQLTGDLKLAQERLAVAQAGLPAMPPEVQRTLRGEVLFRTNDSTVTTDTTSHLTTLGQVLSATPGAIVILDSYADARGSDQDNMELSMRRAQSVRDALIAGGLAPERIGVAAHGEQQAVSNKGDVDGYALERRVVITVGNEETAVAQSGEASGPQ